jgi:hypothetical protein
MLHLQGGDLLVVPLDRYGAMRIKALEMVAGCANGYPIHGNARFCLGSSEAPTRGRLVEVHHDTLLHPAECVAGAGPLPLPACARAIIMHILVVLTSSPQMIRFFCSRVPLPLLLCSFVIAYFIPARYTILWSSHIYGNESAY